MVSSPRLFCLFSVTTLLICIMPVMVLAQGAKNTELISNNDQKTKSQLSETEQKEKEQLLQELDQDFQTSDQKKAFDPLQPMNRVFFQLNDKLYFYLFKPTAQVYSHVLAKPFREGIDNAFYNLRSPGRVINNLLQAKFKRAAQETGRFLINTCLGFLGLIDPAQGVDCLKEPPEEDTGLTFGTWGIDGGPYIVWPVLGPSNLRDSVGLVGDYFLDPVSYVQPDARSRWIKGEDKLNNFSLRLGEYEDMKEASIDPYIAVRNFYTQKRRSEVKE